ncbi:hypothetical protein AB0E62_00430 [Streptomyces sp. NPDC038707]|uniref:hypothetical protein n=1 Tax=Streptomyces sp. NPDC038707 TaxID=3154329 RepID=UPI0033D3AF12
MEQKPTVGRIVHYVSYGTPGGEYTSQCRAAVITEAPRGDSDLVGLAVLNPEGAFFNRYVPQSEGEHRGGTWPGAGARLMTDEQPEHVWYRGRQLSDDSYGLLCVTGSYHWGAVSAEVAMNFTEWTEALYLDALDVIDPINAAAIRAAAERGEEIAWQLP